MPRRNSGYRSARFKSAPHGALFSFSAGLAGIDQADVSRLANGKISRFSLDRLLTIIDRLGIAIHLEQRRDEDGHLVVEVRELARA